MKNLRTGVYCWRNKVNDKRYIGSASISFHRRKNKHLWSLRKGVANNKHLQHAWNKYGECNFEWIELEECPPENCIEREQYYIDQLRATDPKYGYNISPTAGSCLGVKHTNETKAKVAQGSRVAHTRPEVRERRAKVFANPEVKARKSAAMKACQSGEEIKRKLSVTHKLVHLRPEVKTKHKARTKEALNQPNVKARHIAALKTIAADTEVQRKKSTTMKDENAKRRMKKMMQRLGL